jgi:hypothetical protein
MIAGLSQTTLKECVNKSIREQYNIPPELLFSLYQSSSDMEQYLKFVFPENIQIEKKLVQKPGQHQESVIPKFFTFMCTDGEGINSFFHCLIYYEMFSKFDIMHDDYDYNNLP